MARPLDPKLKAIASSAVVSLRSALDQATFAIALAVAPVGAKPITAAYFPFSRSATEFENVLKGRCGTFPKEIQSLLRGFQPYQGGDHLLYALHEAGNRNKHGIIHPLVSVAISEAERLRSTPKSRGEVSIPLRHVWDRAKNEMELFTVGPGADFNADFIISFNVSFGEIREVSGQPAVAALDGFIRKVEEIVEILEAASRRLGLI